MNIRLEVLAYLAELKKALQEFENDIDAGRIFKLGVDANDLLNEVQRLRKHVETAEGHILSRRFQTGEIIAGLGSDIDFVMDIVKVIAKVLENLS
jgi:hypothetical protein